MERRALEILALCESIIFLFFSLITPKNASGLFSFASTTLILSLYNAQARGIHVANAVVGMACFCGGLAQLLAGMWEFPRGNTFGGTGELVFLSINPGA